jgi:hypothetical protein
MSRIKSALEIALEKTESVEADPEVLEVNRYRKEGKVLVSKFLEDTSFNFKESLKGYDKKTLTWVKGGMLEVLNANLVLPQDQLGLTKVKRLGEAFSALIRNRKLLDNMFSQLTGFFEEYLSEKDRVREGLEKQYEPRRRQKEEELSKKMGQPIHIDINSDPEYAEILRKSLAQLEMRYGDALTQAKDQLKSIFQGES